MFESLTVRWWRAMLAMFCLLLVMLIANLFASSAQAYWGTRCSGGRCQSVWVDEQPVYGQPVRNGVGMATAPARRVGGGVVGAVRNRFANFRSNNYGSGSAGGYSTYSNYGSGSAGSYGSTTYYESAPIEMQSGGSAGSYGSRGSAGSYGNAEAPTTSYLDPAVGKVEGIVNSIGPAQEAAIEKLDYEITKKRAAKLKEENEVTRLRALRSKLDEVIEEQEAEAEKPIKFSSLGKFSAPESISLAALKPEVWQPIRLADVSALASVQAVKIDSRVILALK